jgi:excinuclease UvrABC nuclease subunit
MSSNVNFLNQPQRQFQEWTVSGNDKRHFLVYRLDERLPQCPGIYLFAKSAGLLGFGWHPIYVGIADDIAQRHSNHERRDDALRWGATHLHVHECENALARFHLEASMIEIHQPPLNKHHR